MMSFTSGALGVLAVFAAAVLPAAAETALSLEFDGATHALSPQMNAGRTGVTRFVTVDAVSIEGVDGPAGLVLELAFTPGARSDDQPHDARISYRPDGWRDYWVSPPDFPPGAVVIDHLDLSGPEPRIAGSFAMPLCFTPSPVHTPDPARCLPASGRFAAPLERD